MSDKPSPDIGKRLEAIEQRLAMLEKHSHPPIDLEPAIREILLEIAAGEAA